MPIPHGPRVLVSLVACTALLLGAAPLAADPPPSEPQAAEPLDFLALVVSLKDEMERHKEKPAIDGPGGELTTAWKLHMRRRAPRMASRAKDLTRSSLWTFDAEGARALRLDPEQWGVVVRRLAALYTELGTAAKGYDAITASPARAIALWDQRNPPPRTTGLTGSGVALRRVRAQIASYRALGEPVPRWLILEIDRLVLQERLELEARIEARRQWEVERENAHRVLREQAAQTQALVDAERGRLAGQLAGIRALAAILQEVEEQRLAGLVQASAVAGAPIPEALGWLAEMARGRQEALRFSDARTSRWGDLLRQKWTVPREKLLRALKAAEKLPPAPVPDDAPPPAEDGR